MHNKHIAYNLGIENHLLKQANHWLSDGNQVITIGGK